MTFIANGKDPEKRRLVDHEKTKSKSGNNEVRYLALFRCADTRDMVMMLTGVVISVAVGAVSTTNLIVYSSFIGSYIDKISSQNLLSDVQEFFVWRNLSLSDVLSNPQILRPYCEDLVTYTNGSLVCEDLVTNLDNSNEVLEAIFKSLGISLVMLVGGTIRQVLFGWTAQRQVLKIRQRLYSKIICQDVAWFDHNKPGDLAVKMTDDINLICRAIESNIPMGLQWSSTAVSSIVVTFIYGWKMTLVMSAVLPLVITGSALASRGAGRKNLEEREAYANAGTVAEQTFSNIKTVVAFGGEEKEAQSYFISLKSAQRSAVVRGFMQGIGMGIKWGFFYIGYALGFFYGGQLIRNQEYTVTQMITVFYTSFVGAINFGYVIPASSGIQTAAAAAVKVFAVMDEKPAIDSKYDKGTQLSSFGGTIQFIDVDFSYPSRPDVQVLSSLNLHIAKGQTVALVGASGSGKSTIVQLLLRFYTALRGQILIDGHDIESLNLRWLRQHIGLVSQEPVLFATTIAENIRYGLKDASMEDIIQASKMANAYDFIMKLPNQFETYVGEHGAQLSGGQKQRIAIARALVKDPKILLLDEATSALDTESEAIVQDALDKARQGRTTLIIAHRLSTIQNADMIVTISEGHVEEMGTHDELIARGGAYSELVHSQLSKLEHASDGGSSTYDEEMIKQRSGSILHNLERSLSHPQEERAESTPETAQTPKKNSMLRILKMSLKDWPYFCAGSTGSFISGAVVPSFGFVFGDVVKFLSSSDVRVQEEMINKYSLITFGIGCVYTLATFVTYTMFGISGATLTTRLRDLLFRSIIKQKISWFDEPKNAVGILTTKLASEATRVQEVLTNSIAMTIQCASAVLLSLCFSAYFSYPIALIFLGIYPVIMFIGRTHVWLSKKFHTETSKALESATALALQSMVNIREVAALTMEEEFHKKYVQTLERSPHGLHRYLVLTSICFGTYLFIPYFVYCLGYALGGYLIEQGTLEFPDYTRVFECLMVGSLILSRIMMEAGDFSAAGAASNSIFAQVDEAPSDDEAAGGSVTLDKFSGSLKFSGVHFRYPTRPAALVLNGLDLKVKPGETLALVGESGCGKSTTIQLLEKFYVMESGAVFLDNHDIGELSTKWLRMQIGLVSQEPVLFDRSLAENIAYGDNTREVGMEEIIEAARTANIHTFIQSLPSGYETNVGNKGTQLSGGQKQRVAIARALIRNPKILLLDEATSALDAESEKVVLEALDRARQGRTCITIAHRLSTIKNVDMIAVLKRGVVAETGTHRQLKSQRGEYYNMLTAQAGNITS